MSEEWFASTTEEALSAVVSAIGILLVAIVVIRLVGLRSLSKMSSFDFGVTVALGSIMAGVAATSTSFLNGVVGLATLFGAQWLISQLRLRAGFGRVVDNEPLLLMAGATVLEANLRQARVTEADLRAKLREANVTDLSQVLAVVLETTGDVSVLHGEGPLDPALLEGVSDALRVTNGPPR